ncbi:MAG: sigma-70 family RNA polymerase sigma factor [Acidobacteriota bacterium]
MATTTAHESFDQHRDYLTGVAYRMLGSLSEAEDMVQESFLRWHRIDPSEIQSPRAWLTTSVTRLCIDHLRSARVQREEYVGPWLPEPVPTDVPETPFRRTELAESLEMALLVVLERLAPAERAAFLLRETFDYSYAEIAAILDKSEAACRQLVHRAKGRVRAERPRFEPTLEERERVVGSFAQALATGELADLVALFAEDITLYSDGGGKVLAALNPIYGADKVARFFLGIRPKAPADLTAGLRQVNGQTAIVATSGGQPYLVMSLDVEGDRLRAIHVMRNPDKLRGFTE